MPYHYTEDKRGRMHKEYIPRQQRSFDGSVALGAIGLLGFVGAGVAAYVITEAVKPDTEVTNDMPSTAPGESLLPTSGPSPTDIPSFEE